MDPHLLEALDELRATALAYPETYEESPWGDRVVKVAKKIFLFAGTYKGRFNFTVKLPETGAEALTLPFTKPTGYGMGKHGWVSSGFGDGDSVPVPLLLEWLDESYRAIAPKRIVKTLPEFGPPDEQPAPPVPEATRGPVLFVGYDPFRAARAAKALAYEAVSSADLLEPGQAAVDAAAELDPLAIIVDVGRNQAEGLDFAGSLAATQVAARPIAITGIRDAKAEARTRDAIPDAALYSRDAPGDPKVVAALLKLL